MVDIGRGSTRAGGDHNKADRERLAGMLRNESKRAEDIIDDLDQALTEATKG